MAADPKKKPTEDAGSKTVSARLETAVYEEVEKFAQSKGLTISDLYKTLTTWVLKHKRLPMDGDARNVATTARAASFPPMEKLEAFLRTENAALAVLIMRSMGMKKCKALQIVKAFYLSEEIQWDVKNLD